MQRKYKTGFTLIEMLIVIGIIAVLMGSTVVGIGKMRKTAQKARTQETVSNAATALSVIFQKEMNWPKLISQNFKSGSYGRLDENVCRAFVTHKLLGLSTDPDSSTIRLTGADRCGLVDTWAQDVLKRTRAEGKGLKVPSGGTVQDHVLYYAIDVDGDGITEASVGGASLKVRASAIVWSAGADGKEDPYKGGGGGDDVYSWSRGQVQK